MQTLREFATTLGFNRLGITRAIPAPTLNAYHAWLDNHYHGAMTYLGREDRIIRRQDLQNILPNAQSLIIVALDYSTLPIPPIDPTRGRISMYAWGADYHEVMLPRLEQLASWLQGQVGAEHQVVSRAYVDTGPILERSHAQQAGLGFVGKNTMLIHPKRGSYFFLGEILTTYAFTEYDKPHIETMCGKCTRCLNACPTDAFPQPYVLDARRCISYLTIELKTTIPEDLRPLMGNWVYGCDVCQEVCPWNRFGVKTLETSFFPATEDAIAPQLADLLALTDDTFRERYAHSPILRIKRERLVRNACIAAGNSGERGFISQLQHLAENDVSLLVQEHAAWAIQRLTDYS